MPWLLNEDAAIKQKLSGIDIPNGNGSERVNVRFRVPETWAEFRFPQIVIDHAALTKADDREHRGRGTLPYAPEGHALWADPTDVTKSPYFLDEWPIPYDLDYQIVVYSRFSQQERMLTALLQQPDYLPARWGYLTIPQDGTVRRLDVLQGPESESSRDGGGKRLFTTTYLIRVSTELLPSTVKQFNSVIEGGVHLDVEYYDPTS